MFSAHLSDVSLRPNVGQRRRALVALALLPVAACIDKVTDGDSTIRGVYTLRTVNGAALPFTKSVVGTTKVEILDDKITLFPANTFAEEWHVRTTVSDQVTTQTKTETGTYAPGFSNSVYLNGNSTTGSRLTIITNGNTMTFNDTGTVYVWKKK